MIYLSSVIYSEVKPILILSDYLSLDRDVNAAINILRSGLDRLDVTHSVG